MIDGYDWSGGHEAMLRFGPATGPVVVATLPLFEEANRLRAFTVTLLRALADRGIAGALPDVPGQGESLVPLETVALSDMGAAFATAVRSVGEGRRTFGFAIRSGALLDGGAALDGRLHFAPQSGPDLLRELDRVRGAGEPGGAADRPYAMIAGNRVAQRLLDELRDMQPVPARIMRLTTDPRPADRSIDGPALWRRSEPDNDIGLAQRLADDIADWIAACGR